MSLALLIPAYQPGEAFLKVVEELARSSRFAALIVVNDGSSPEFAPLFEQAARLPGVHLLRHAVNLGKGAALKTGMNHALCQVPSLAGIVTADADGQHLPEDILRVAARLEEQPATLVLGVRGFSGHVPLRSRFGNSVTRGVVRLLVGQNLTDTQTGLRGIPASLLPALLRIPSTGYDFELDMLIRAKQLDCPVGEVPIQTVYEPGNQSSHFNPLLDSMKIYFVLLRFCSVSLVTAGIDNLVFYLAWRHLHNILEAQLLGRVAAVTFNYFAVRRAVFFASKASHTLPRYLLLVLVSGTVSYSCIRAVTAAVPIPVIWAKIAVESLIFFANFAIQRDFIFARRDGKESAPVPAVGNARLMRWIGFGLAVLTGIAIYGFATGHLFTQQIWYAQGLIHARRYLLLFLAIFLPVAVLAPRYFVAIAVLLVAVGTTLAVGPLPLLVVLFLLWSATVIGNRVLGEGDSILSLLLGMAVFIFGEELLVRVPWNYPWVYAGLILLPLALSPGLALRTLRSGASLLRPADLGSFATRAAALVTTLILMGHWLIVLKPEASADGLAMHLAIPEGVAWKHQFAFELPHNLWAAMPMGGDWCFTLAYLMGGEFASRLLNFAFLLVTAALLFYAVRRFLIRDAALWMVALFAFTPLVQQVTGSLFIENILAAVIFGALAALWRFERTGEQRFLFASALLFGTALHIKFGSLAFVIPGLVLLGAQIHGHWKRLGARPMLTCGLTALIVVAAGAPPYINAFVKTGDPVFPFLSQTFHASGMPKGAAPPDDQRYKQPLRWSTLYDLTFHTNSYHEGQDGSFGFQYILLLPAGVLVVRRSGYVAWSACLVAFTGSAIVLFGLPNLRYLYPALPLFHVVIALLFARLDEAPAAVRSLVFILLAACLGLDAWFLPSASWYHKGFYTSPLFREKGRVKYLESDAPDRVLIAQLNRQHPGEAVLFMDGTDIADLRAPAYRDHWHDMETYFPLHQARTPEEALALIAKWKIPHYLVPLRAGVMSLDSDVLQPLVSACLEPESRFGDYVTARLAPDCAKRLAEKNNCFQTPAGRTCDDAYPEIQFTGAWTLHANFAPADGKTVSFSNQPGATIRFQFDGPSVTYVYTKAANRGIAEIAIDGKPAGTVDLYSPETQWQSRTVFDKLAPGAHTLEVRVTGRKQAASKDTFVDLDSFVSQ